MCVVITPVAVIIQSSNKIVKFIENVMILSQNMENYYSEEKIEL